MKVKSIEIIQLKSIEREIIELSPNINLLIGANNSGKSTVIKTLLNLQYRSFESTDVRALLPYSRIYYKLTEITGNDSLRFYSKEFHTDFFRAKEIEVYWSVLSNDNAEDFYYYDPSHNVKRNELDVFKITNKRGAEVRPSRFPRFPDSEDADNFIFPFLAKRKTDYYNHNISREEAFKVSTQLANLASKIQVISNSSHPMNDEFNRLCQEILGFKIGVIPTDKNRGNGMEPGIFVTSTETIPIRAMGEGVYNIVGFISTLLTEDHKLYLVEELENDIHPLALKNLLNLIIKKSHNNQFVISTHSHIVLKYLGAIPDTKIIYFDWSPVTTIDGKTITIPTSSIKVLENSPQSRIEVLEKLGYDFHDFDLYDSYLILEESSAERVIRDFLIPHFVPELYNKIKTIASKGVTDLEPRVKDFNRLFVYIHTNPIYHKKAWVIADGDEGGIRCINNLKEEFKSWPKNHFINFEASNFEEYYPPRFQAEVKNALNAKGKAKRDAKEKLIKDVMEWALSNRDTAIDEFGESAKEVIEILKAINKSLTSKKK